MSPRARTEFRPISPDLIELTRRWPLKTSTYTARDGTEKDCMRCAKDDCEEMIQGNEELEQGILIHLLCSHGYRMNGRQYNNQNRPIGDAKDACSEENSLP